MAPPDDYGHPDETDDPQADHFGLLTFVINASLLFLVASLLLR